jgi:hydroxymethylbilane synthase
MKIKVGSRASRLAIWQAEFVCQRINQHGIETEIVPIETKGDKILNQSIYKIGSKGLFTQELESKLLEGSIDIAVHSAKDVQSELHNELEIIAFTEREKPHDVLISFKTIDVNKLENYLIGTSSTRRKAFLYHYYPNVRVVDARGNLQTRIQKLKSGNFDVLMLAYAGVCRLGYESMIVHHFSESLIVPPAGQGSLAIEASKKLSNEIKILVRKAVHHQDTEICLRAERSYLYRLSGGCSIPSFAYAHKKNDNLFEITAGIVSLDGLKMVKFHSAFEPNEAYEAGVGIAEKVLENGGAEILFQIKRQIKN